MNEQVPSKEQVSNEWLQARIETADQLTRAALLELQDLRRIATRHDEELADMEEVSTCHHDPAVLESTLSRCDAGRHWIAYRCSSCKERIVLASAPRATHEPSERHYEIQTIPGPPDDRERTNYRITDKRTDSRVATCYEPSNARLICDALNGSAQPPPDAHGSRESWMRWAVHLQTCTDCHTEDYCETGKLLRKAVEGVWLDKPTTPAATVMPQYCECTSFCMRQSKNIHPSLCKAARATATKGEG